MPTLHGPCGAVEVPVPTRETLLAHAKEWADDAGDAYIAGLTALVNGNLDKACECFKSAQSRLNQVCNGIDDAAKLPVSG